MGAPSSALLLLLSEMHGKAHEPFFLPSSKAAVTVPTYCSSYLVVLGCFGLLRYCMATRHSLQFFHPWFFFCLDTAAQSSVCECVMSHSLLQCCSWSLNGMCVVVATDKCSATKTRLLTKIPRHKFVRLLQHIFLMIKWFLFSIYHEMRHAECSGL